MPFGPADLRSAVTRISAAASSAKDELNSLDGMLGDGDLGITLSNGWAEADASDLPEDDLGRAFLEVSKAFQRVSSSSFGTLLATGMMAAAKAMKGRREAEFSEIPQLVGAARDAMMARGRGELGQKSVLDVLDALARETDGHDDPAELAAVAVKAVADTLDEFRDRVAGLGRARMYGDASRGLDDPGMLAVKRMLDGLLEG